MREGLIERRYRKPPKDDDSVLVYRSGRRIIRRYFENLCIKVRAEVPSLGKDEPDWFSTHGLRHTAGTMVQRVGGDAVARRFLGHAARGWMHVENYSKATIDEVREALAAIWGEPLPGPATVTDAANSTSPDSNNSVQPSASNARATSGDCGDRSTAPTRTTPTPR